MSSQDGIPSSPTASLSAESEEDHTLAQADTSHRLVEQAEIGTSDEAAIENAFVGDVADDAADDEVNLEWDDADDEAASDDSLVETSHDEAGFVTRLSLSDELVAEDSYASEQAVAVDGPKDEAALDLDGRTDILVCRSGSEPALERADFEPFETRGSTAVPSDRQECLSSGEVVDSQSAADSASETTFEAAAAPLSEPPFHGAGPAHRLAATAHDLQAAADELLHDDAREIADEEAIGESAVEQATEAAIDEAVEPVGDDVSQSPIDEVPIVSSEAATQPKPFWQSWMPSPRWLRRSAAGERAGALEESASPVASERFDDAPPEADDADSAHDASEALHVVSAPAAEVLSTDALATGTADEPVAADVDQLDEHHAEAAIAEESFGEDSDAGDELPPYNGYSEGHPGSIDEEDEAESAAVGSTGGGWSIPLLCIGIAVIACCMIIPQADVNRRLSYERQSLRQDLESVQAQVATNDEFLRKLAADPQLAERLAQRQLKLMRPGDKLLPIAQGNTGTSPFELVQIAPPKQLPPYQPIGGEVATLCYNPHTRLYLMGGGLFLMAAALVLSIETVPSTRMMPEIEPPAPEA